MGTIVLEKTTETLEEVVVNIKQPTIQKQAGKLVFNVENTSLSVGSTFDILKKTPGVVVVGESIQVKFSSPTIYINGKRVYLSSAEIVSLLQNVDASVIKSIEVITNPSSKYDAEAGTVLNIITSKVISIGYKGSINGRYEQAIFPKYSLGTSHFYKNNWINFYGSYSFNPRKDFKEDDNNIRFFEPDGSVNSLWGSNFKKVSRSKTHQANIITDFTLSEKQTLGISATILVSPNKTFNNTGFAEIFDAQRQLDSTFTTLSFLENDSSNLSFNLDYKIDLNNEGSNITTSVNYINYNNEQLQDVNTNYFLPNGTLLRNNSFFTNAKQQSNIFTGQVDLNTSLFSGGFKAGLKYSNIDTESSLDFFDTESNVFQFNESLSDDFNYKENIYSEYINYEKDWKQWNFTAGLRGEFTSINSISRSLGELNTQNYFELFPSASVTHKIDDNNTIGVSYKRTIQRPRYQSLNPFRYFITENNFNGGNPNLVPAIESKIMLSYDYKNKLFFELFYQNLKNNLSVLTFQDNESRTIRNIDTNLIKDFQYSLDITYINSFTSWWYFQAITSSFYLENEFFAIESPQETYSNDTFGFFAQMYSGLTISKERSLTSDVTLLYISNLISGSYDYKNQFTLSVSFRKSFWDKKASISAGVDDIFDTNNFPLASRYYNQDNGYFARAESRLFRVGFRYNFGNSRLRDNNRSSQSEEGNRLNND